MFIKNIILVLYLILSISVINSDSYNYNTILPDILSLQEEFDNNLYNITKVNEIRRYTVNTVYYPLINSLYSEYEFYINNNYYKSLYYIQLAINDNNFDILENRFQQRIYSHLLKTLLKLNMYEDIVNYTSRTPLSIIYNDIGYLTISESYFRLNNLIASRINLMKVNRERLNNDDRLKYDLIFNKTSIKRIDTSNIGYHDPNVSSLALDRDVLYIGLWHGGLISYNYNTDRYRFFGHNELGALEVRAIYVDNRYIYVGTTGGCYLLDKRDDSIKSIDELKNFRIYSINGDSSNIYLGTLDDGLIVYNKNTREFYSPIRTGSSVSSISVLNDRVFIGTVSGSIFLLNKTQLTLSSVNLPFQINKPVTGIGFRDNKLWISTHGQGIIAFSTTENTFSVYDKTIHHNFSNDHILSLVIHGDLLYCSSLENGVVVFNTNNNEYRSLDIYGELIYYDSDSVVVTDTHIFIGTLGEGVIVKIR